MPIISHSHYKSPHWFLNGHFDTIFPALFRKVSLTDLPQKLTIHTPDQDVFDLDHYDQSSDKTVIISHGLEGNNQRPYVLGMAKIFLQNGWNVITWNYRGCNGTANKTIKSYHSGFTEDLIEVINFASQPSTIKTIALIGFSLGGNLTLKYLGGKQISKKIKVAATISVPLDLHQSCLQISQGFNILYSKRFLKTLKQKVREKALIFPEIPTEYLTKTRDLKTFDDHYTAPMHGFQDALDYYQSCSSLHVLHQIKVPSLIINAINDPFLSESCYPYPVAQESEFVHLETPLTGGHVGFYNQNNDGVYWSEKRAFEFVNANV